jgi:hypothetical protein
MEDVGIFYGHLVHFTVFCYISRTFGMALGKWVYFSRFGILYQEISGNQKKPFALLRLERHAKNWARNNKKMSKGNQVATCMYVRTCVY